MIPRYIILGFWIIAHHHHPTFCHIIRACILYGFRKKTADEDGTGRGE